MKQRVLVALLTVLVFASGFAARAWTESTRALPPPPAPIGSEFVPASAVPAPRPDTKKPADRRAQLIADIEKLGPQITMFRSKMEELDAEFEREIMAVLNDDQRHRWEARVADVRKHMEKARSDAAAKSGAMLTDEEIEQGLRTPYSMLFSKVTVSEKLKRITERYGLDAGQQAQARDLLLKYREKFLALVDSIPPTSFKLMSLAQDVQKLVPAKK